MFIRKPKAKSLILFFFIFLQLFLPLFNFKIGLISTSRAKSGKIVAFDETHLPMTVVNISNPYATLAGTYASFTEQLETRGYIIETINFGKTINQETLQNYDILVIIASQTPYTEQEINEIGAWVENGGSLLLITDWWIYGNGVRDLINYFGYNYPIEDGLRESDDLVGNMYQFYIDESNFKTHEITSGVSRIEVYAATGLIDIPYNAIIVIDTDNDNTTTWDTSGFANNIPILSVLSRGSILNGKLVVITDINLWNDVYDTDEDGSLNFYDSDNAVLALNIMNWLSSPSGLISSINWVITTFILILLGGITIINKKSKK